MENVIKNVTELYELRNKIVNEIKKAKKKDTDNIDDTDDTEDYKTDLSWIHGSKDELEKLKKMVSEVTTFNIKIDGEYVARTYPLYLKKVLEIILEGKINNKTDAENRYYKKLVKIMILCLNITR